MDMRKDLHLICNKPFYGKQKHIRRVPVTSDTIPPVCKLATLSQKFTPLQANQTINEKVVTDFKGHRKMRSI
jgi:hypothetical protein